MINIVHKGKGAKTLVVFIHGLQGDESTWLNTNTGLSFIYGLANDKALKSKFSFGSFNYYSKLLDAPAAAKQGMRIINKIFGSTNKKIQLNLNVEEISQLLFTYLETFSTDYKTIVLVCHSMGGLIAKSLVINHSESDVVKKIGLIVSLAVPHNGSFLAHIGQSILPNVQLRDLAPLDSKMTSLTQSWIKNKDINPKIVYFQGNYDTVVKGSSAVGFDANELDIKYCDEDHESIAKPASTESLVYVAVKNQLLALVSKKELEESLNATEAVNPDDFEDELYVVKMLIAKVHPLLVNTAKQRFFDAERAKKAILISGLHKQDLEKLYSKIQQIYVNEFGKVLSGKLKGGDELVTAVHEQITREDLALLKSIERLDFTHKIGMIHQLANVEKDIWWANEHSIKTVEEFKMKKSQSE